MLLHICIDVYRVKTIDVYMHKHMYIISCIYNIYICIMPLCCFTCYAKSFFSQSPCPLTKALKSFKPPANIGLVANFEKLPILSSGAHGEEVGAEI